MKSLHTAALICLTALLLFTFVPETNAAEAPAITHSFIGFGKANKTVIVGDDGKIQWQFNMPASDGWVLPNGNVLLALYGTKGFPNGGVIEVERATKKIIFQYKGQQKEVSTVLPLKNNTYLVAELGPQPRAIVINRKGEILKKTLLQCQKQNDHMQTRMLRVLPNGNYVIGNCHAGPGNPLLVEIEPKSKKVVWTLDRFDTFGNSVPNSQLLDVKGAIR